MRASAIHTMVWGLTLQVTTDHWVPTHVICMRMKALAITPRGQGKLGQGQYKSRIAWKSGFGDSGIWTSICGSICLVTETDKEGEYPLEEELNVLEEGLEKELDHSS